MTLSRDIESLFETFDAEADGVLDQVIVSDDAASQAAIANGLAIRLVQWCLGDGTSGAEAEAVATSLVTELATLRRNIKQRSEDQ